jgi:hypothetical protein
MQASHFSEMQIVFDLVLCGDWAGNVFEQQCPNCGSCVSYVQQNPAKLAEASAQYSLPVQCSLRACSTPAQPRLS